MVESEKTIFQEMLEHIESKSLPARPNIIKKKSKQAPAPQAKELNPILEKIESFGESGVVFPVLNEEWEKEHLSELVETSLQLKFYRSMFKKIDIVFVGCKKDESSFIEHLIDQAVENLLSRIYANFWEIKEVDATGRKVATPLEKIELDRADLEAILGLIYFQTSSLMENMPTLSEEELENELTIKKKFTAIIEGGAKGGLLAAKNRAETRENIKMKVKDVIHKHYLWNDAAQTAKSITDRLWVEIKTSIDDGNDWQGIAHADLLQAKVGRQSVYNTVTETDPR